jgi:bifunctional DNase/RNase
MPTFTDTGFVSMRVSNVTALGQAVGEDVSYFVVLDQLDGDRHLVILIGPQEALGLAASLGGMEWARPMTYQFVAALVRALGGRVRAVRLDRVVDGAYAATVEVEGSGGVELVDARSSDALNLAVVLDAPVFAGPEMLADCARRMEGDSPEATLARSALTAGPMTFRRPDETGEEQSSACVPDEPC